MLLRHLVVTFDDACVDVHIVVLSFIAFCHNGEHDAKQQGKKCREMDGGSVQASKPASKRVRLQERDNENPAGCDSDD